MADATLLPCPFCASRDVEIRESITDTYIACNNCGCRTGLIYLGASDASNAAKLRELIALWNTRQPQLPSDDGLIKALERVKKAGDELKCLAANGRPGMIAEQIGEWGASIEALSRHKAPLSVDKVVDGLIRALEGIANAVRIGAETDVQAWVNLAYACQHTAREALSRHKAPLSTSQATPHPKECCLHWKDECPRQAPVAGDDVERMRATLHKSRSWLFECWGWLLETDLDMKCPMETDPLDIVEEIDALLGIEAALTALQVTEGDKS